MLCGFYSTISLYDTQHMDRIDCNEHIYIRISSYNTPVQTKPNVKPYSDY